MTEQTVDSDRVLITERVFDAPRELVFKAWTEPEHIVNWYGPDGFNTRVEEYEFEVGGAWKYVMVGPDGSEKPIVGTFTEITPPERVVTSDTSEGAFGLMLTVSFEDLGGKTKLTLHTLHTSIEQKKMHEEYGVMNGWQASFNRLEAHVASLAS